MFQLLSKTNLLINKLINHYLMYRPTQLHTPHYQYLMLWNMLLLFIREPKIKNAIFMFQTNNNNKNTHIMRILFNGLCYFSI